MKNLLALLSIALLSSTVHAVSTIAEFGAVLNPITTESSNFPALVVAKYEQNDSNLWEILDTDKDGFISKDEAQVSKQLLDRWNSLDDNNDEKLDTAEFAQIFTQTN